MNNTPMTSGEVKRDPRYQHEELKLAGSSMYVRIDTGPDLEESLLCVDDGEPDCHAIARFANIDYARAFAEFWNSRLATPNPHTERENG